MKILFVVILLTFILITIILSAINFENQTNDVINAIKHNSLETGYSTVAPLGDEYKRKTTATRMRIEVNGYLTVEHDENGHTERYQMPVNSPARQQFIDGEYQGEYWDVETRTEFLCR